MKRGKQKVVPIHDATDIYLSRKAGGLAAKVLAMLTPHVQPGVSTEELDKICHDYIVNDLKWPPSRRQRPNPRRQQSEQSAASETGFRQRRFRTHRARQTGE